MGKTELVIEYVHRYWFGDHAVFWIRADATANTLADFVLLAKHLGLPVRDEAKPDEAVADVKRWLARHKDWLLVFDNADDPEAVEPFLPPATHQGSSPGTSQGTSQGRVLLTTRCQSSSTANLIALDAMSVDEGVQLLLKRARLDTSTQTDQDLQVCRDLVQQMGGLPLALDQAGAFIDQKKCSIQRYAMLYEESAADLLAERGQGRRYPQSVATTWTISIDQVRSESPLAIDLLHVCAFLHPDAIPVDLVEHIIPSCASFDPRSSPARQLERAVGVVMRFSLLGRRQSAGPSGQVVDALSMHRLVQLVVRSSLDDASGQRWAQAVVSGVVSHIDSVDASRRWGSLKQLLPQMQVCAGHVSSHHLASD
jgi:hypothetical protein